jgi:ABC-type cobalamin/Fe3+-siderophores transport system ATPase subunit
MNDARIVEEIGTALRDLQRTTESLFHVGVGLLVHGGDDVVFRGGLRRAFPWLLGATRKWLDSPHSKPPQAPDQPAAGRRLERLSLSNYRLPGVRIFELARNRVHLVHGPNGSGKSSLVEALEIMTNGKVQRIERAQERAQKEDYDRVIRHRRALEPASIELSWDGGASDGRLVGQTGVEQPLARGVAASSFRLDQPLMERLVDRPPHERAQHFLEAFFPEAMVSLTVYAEATKSLAVALGALHKYVEDFQAARTVLGEIQGWRGGSATPTSEQFPDVLNEWLERNALADLAQREHHVLATLQAARADRWRMTREPATGVLGEVNVDIVVVAQQAKRWAGDIEDLQRKLAHFRPSTRVEQEREGAVQAITPQQSETLNRVSQWLFEGDVLQQYGRFGDKIAKVMSAGDAPTFGSIVIGGEGWAEPLLNVLEASARIWRPRNEPRVGRASPRVGSTTRRSSSKLQCSTRVPR